MAVELPLVLGLAGAVLAGLTGTGFLLRIWSAIRRGPGGDLSREVLYLRGPSLVRPFAVLLCGLVLTVLVAAYWLLLEFSVVPPYPDLRFHLLVLQAVLLFAGGIAFYRSLRSFTPSARTSRRREVLQRLSSAMQNRARAMRRKE